MIDGNRILAIIPARGGSRAKVRILPRSPVSLFAWTIGGKESKYVDRIVLSSDDRQIQEIAELLGCEVPFTRAAHLATDEAATIDVLVDVLERVTGFDVVVLLQPTSPLRTAEDIDSCLNLMMRDGAPSVVSLCAVEDHPALVVKFQNENQITPFLPISKSISAPPGSTGGFQTQWRCLSAKNTGCSERDPSLLRFSGLCDAEAPIVDIDDRDNLFTAEQLLSNQIHRKP